jgi:hypothetical protein
MMEDGQSCRLCKSKSSAGQFEYWALCQECAKKLKINELRKEFDEQFPDVTKFVNLVGAALRKGVEENRDADVNDVSEEADESGGGEMVQSSPSSSLTAVKVAAALECSLEFVDERKVAARAAADQGAGPEEVSGFVLESKEERKVAANVVADQGGDPVAVPGVVLESKENRKVAVDMAAARGKDPEGKKAKEVGALTLAPPDEEEGKVVDQQVVPAVSKKRKRVRKERVVSDARRAESDAMIAAGLTEEEKKYGVLIVFFAPCSSLMNLSGRKCHFYRKCQYLLRNEEYFGLAEKKVEKDLYQAGCSWTLCTRCRVRHSNGVVEK